MAPVCRVSLQTCNNRRRAIRRCLPPSVGGVAVARDERRALAVERMRVRALPIPDGYAFDRDEANAR